MDRADVYKVIDDERDFQDSKWGNQHDKGHGVGDWLTLLDSHVRKAQDAYTDNAGDLKALEEVRKVAAIAVACLEVHGAPSRFWLRPKQQKEG